MTSDVKLGIDLERVVELISKYDQIKKSDGIKNYNEESTKKDFILPLFEALGWNVYNKGKRDDYISAEETISKKRVDYGFRINGIPKFFLEAKALREPDIEKNSKYVNQAIDYAWMKSCSWAILTNFETIAVYNADWKSSDIYGNLFFILHPKDFLTDERFKKLSKDSFEANELNDEASKYGKKQLKNPIDKQLLQDMIHFREILSKDIIKNNQDKHLTQEDVDEAVQRILDRLIFIRNAEDRELEENRLQSNVRQWASKGKGQLAKEISKVYAYFDDQYNSKLFAKHLCDDLYLDNEVLIEVIEGLNHSKDNSYSYDFSIIESDVLGNIYEQYLGNILKATPKRAKLSESKTHRKEQGIYYTPSYIVDYIVKNTVGEFIRTHTPEEIRKVRILDPACGSGSFLIRAYKELENYWKQNSDFAQLTLDSEGFYSKKVEILKNNIFGVDLDPKAVEIAQLNLLLQISERKQKLPLLQSNIKVGNSLIDDPNITDKAFKWGEEFPEIMKEGGFDIVIGNPPYGAELSELERRFVSKKFRYFDSNRNTALLFIGKSLELTKFTGYFGMIVPKSLAFSQHWKLGRELIKEYLTKVVDVNKGFEGVLLEQMIIILDKFRKSNYYELQDISSNESLQIKKVYIDLTDSIVLNGIKQDLRIFEKMNSSNRHLSEVSITRRGLPLQKYIVKESTKYPVVKGKTISRYIFWSNNEFLLEKVIDGNKNKAEFLRQPKVISQRIVAHVTKPKEHIVIMSALDRQGFITVDTVENTISRSNDFSLEFITCLLNSKLISWYAYRYIFSKAIRTMDLDEYYIGKIPLPNVKIENIDFMNLLNRMMTLKTMNSEIIAKGTDKQKSIEAEILKIDSLINQLIYDYYGLTESEKNIIENS